QDTLKDCDQVLITGGGLSAVRSDVPASGKDAPIVIQNCTMQGEVRGGIVVEGRERDNIDRPVPCGRAVLRNNHVVGCGNGLVRFGAVHEVHVVGNRLHSNHGGIDLVDLRQGAADILVANNTIMGSDAALRIWDDHAKGKQFLKCKNIRVHNNLV